MSAATATSLDTLETTIAAPPDCPIGSVTIRSDGQAITAVSFAADGTASARPAARDGSDHPLLRRAAAQLRDYFAGTRTSFDLPLGARGTEWQESVWRALREIPYGTTATYGDVARRAGNAKAARAVGAANHVNPLGIIVPCHRVIGSDGSLIGYAGGLDAKSWLLLHERRVLSAGR
jgi:methylated-DNA-[protein]-cysteine S-methyltransferase